MGLSQKLAAYVNGLRYKELPENVVSYTKLCILDYFASAIAGSSKEPIQIITEMVKEMGGDAQASLLTGGKSSVLHASLVNGAASHIMELDDIHKSSIIHAGTVIIPAALAIAEWKGSNGKELITAIVSGYEIAYRIGEAVSPSHYYYWHNTATCGTFGAAVAAAKLLRLSEQEIVHTLGSAGTQAAGLWEFIEDGAMSKQLHPGKAAMNGVMSALLGAKGFTGASRILEGRRGFFEAMSDEYNSEKITEGLGKQFKIMENSFKVHASCRHTHHVMDMMIALKQNGGINPDDIEEIKIGTYQVAINITDNEEPKNEYGAKFSMQFCTALALLTGSGNFDQFNQDTLWAENIRDLMHRIKVEVDPIYEKAYPEKWGARVKIKLKSGEVLLMQADYPKGDPENPVSKEDLLAKFMKLTAPMPGRESFANLILKLDTMHLIDGIMGVACNEQHV